ncbi:hypothetical protein H5410_022064 [Solanum commersonii]|uniref:Uncharacterized protein n=1 Tax=Solanum commersonii TaxID=4109 RepID=A0A9J5ZFP2_SOLCO|nr:hypothetical protein H5410_022064 [Solanum commersonii]
MTCFTGNSCLLAERDLVLGRWRMCNPFQSHNTQGTVTPHNYLRKKILGCKKSRTLKDIQQALSQEEASRKEDGEGEEVHRRRKAPAEKKPKAGKKLTQDAASGKKKKAEKSVETYKIYIFKVLKVSNRFILILGFPARLWGS